MYQADYCLKHFILILKRFNPNCKPYLRQPDYTAANLAFCKVEKKGEKRREQINSNNYKMSFL